MGRIFITTSRRPTTRSRSLLKDLVSVLPNAVRIVRGHATLEKLALEAFDVGADKIIVLRNWKGNPRFVDFYEVLGPGKYRRMCTLVLKGFKLIRECGFTRPTRRPRELLVRKSVVVSEEIPSDLIECILRGFEARVCDDVAVTNDCVDCVEIGIESKANFFELLFRSVGLNVVGPVLRIWKAKLYSTVQT